eukprot:6205095-Pleurochrysis_carterae.AAC.7
MFTAGQACSGVVMSCVQCYYGGHSQQSVGIAAARCLAGTNSAADERRVVIIRSQHHIQKAGTQIRLAQKR